MRVRTGLIAVFTGLFCLMSTIALAQRGGRGGGGDRGGDGGGRGPGGGGRGFGGPGGGGPGGGGPGGGRGSGGGFDPSGFISRLDSNGNGMIDPAEMQGPAKMMIDRMARSNPNIDTSKPIPISKITESFQQMQASRSGGSTRSSGGGEDRQKLEDAMLIEQLVMGFDPPEALEPVAGFGSAGELFSIRVLPADERTAKDRMGRYDRNRNGYIDKSEMNGWMGNPLDFDRNGDQRLSASELAVRYAHRRVAEEDIKKSSSASDNKRNDRRRDSRDSDDDPYDGRKSYVLQGADQAKEGLPGWFAERDVNEDGQVIMAEYASDWSDALVTEFFKFDMNEDGSISARECIAAVEDGAVRSSAASAGGPPRTASSSSGSSSTSASTAAKSNANVAPVAASKLEKRYLDTAKNIVKRNDKNNDGVLTASEWKTMFLDISPSDANKDGRITLEEYAGWMQARSKR